MKTEMDEQHMTYHTPSTAVRDAEELKGALRYGWVRGSIDRAAHRVAIIETDGDDVLCSGPTFFGWRSVKDVAESLDTLA